MSTVALGTGNRAPPSKRTGPVLTRPGPVGCLLRHAAAPTPRHASLHCLLLTRCLFLLTSCPSLLGPRPKIRLQRESRELLKSERSKLWLSSTSKVWSTRPMVKPVQQKWQRGPSEACCNPALRPVCPHHPALSPNVLLTTRPWHPPAVASWHLSKDQRTSTACPRSLICCSISRNFARTCDTENDGFKDVLRRARGQGPGLQCHTLSHYFQKCNWASPPYLGVPGDQSDLPAE